MFGPKILDQAPKSKVVEELARNKDIPKRVDLIELDMSIENQEYVDSWEVVGSNVIQQRKTMEEEGNVSIQ